MSFYATNHRLRADAAYLKVDQRLFTVAAFVALGNP
jgi:hypothetical protein